MTNFLKTDLVRVGRAKTLTRSSDVIGFPEVDNPIENYA